VGPFWTYIRTKGKILVFDDFSDVVRYIIEMKREDSKINRGHWTCGETK
jgi:hypothetical protein